MAKKSSKPKSKDFANNPFRDLKGLSVSASAPPEAPKKEFVPRPPPAPPLSEEELFAAEMALLGVAQKDEANALEKPLPPETERRAPAKAPPRATPEDEFLAAVGQLDVTFSDDYPEPLPPDDLPRAAPRRMRQLRRGQLLPEATLDLHGLFREPALEKVRWFLQDAAYQRQHTVLIVTGRGQHSAEGPVLREAVARYLREQTGKLVLEWGVAPPRLGGDGALVVFLRSSGGGGEG
ncbi:Smr/MutS family protein [Desulfuromonas carbonis]|uniref:Smr/MutS family protein n=1 Tax=Desulfuromonas sp. DDH964 TaxID=1823759 RepID=UPI00078DF8C3|nr:Smr/MutS family protein [Desulfuromonas sp. DDH964]AMV72913.1 Smr domain-containing protein [Desulfuromonas sp. DDH964]